MSVPNDFITVSCKVCRACPLPKSLLQVSLKGGPRECPTRQSRKDAVGALLLQNVAECHGRGWVKLLSRVSAIQARQLRRRRLQRIFYKNVRKESRVFTAISQECPAHQKCIIQNRVSTGSYFSSAFQECCTRQCHKTHKTVLPGYCMSKASVWSECFSKLSKLSCPTVFQDPPNSQITQFERCKIHYMPNHFVLYRCASWLQWNCQQKEQAQRRRSSLATTANRHCQDSCMISTLGIKTSL